MADLLTLQNFAALSPFEIKDELIKLARNTSRTTQSAFLNAGRGNPNWVATANSGAIFENGAPTPQVPEPTSIILLGTVCLGLAGVCRKRLQRNA